MRISTEDIIKEMEQLQNGRNLIFRFPPVFGGGVALVGLNPEYPDNKGKKYVLKLGKEEAIAEKASPILTSDKPKPLAKWITERFGEQMG